MSRSGKTICQSSIHGGMELAESARPAHRQRRLWFFFLYNVIGSEGNTARFSLSLLLLLLLLFSPPAARRVSISCLTIKSAAVDERKKSRSFKRNLQGQVPLDASRGKNGEWVPIVLSAWRAGEDDVARLAGLSLENSGPNGPTSGLRWTVHRCRRFCLADSVGREWQREILVAARRVIKRWEGAPRPSNKQKMADSVDDGNDDDDDGDDDDRDRTLPSLVARSA